jgi:tetratricopeptide (TPR) repeat protein
VNPLATEGWHHNEVFKDGAQRIPIGSIIYQHGFEALKVNRPREALEVLSGLDPERADLGYREGRWRQLTAALHMLGEHRRELREARRARSRYPDSPSMLRVELRALGALGRTDEVRDLIEESILAAEEPAAAMTVAADELRAHGYNDASREILERALAWYQSRSLDEQESMAHRSGVAATLYRLERWEEAGALYWELLRENPRSIAWLGEVGTVAARMGNGEEAHRIAAELAELDLPYTRASRTIQRARIAAILGQRDRAVSLLREAHAQGASYGLWLHTNIDLEPLREYPAFEDFLRPKG